MMNNAALARPLSPGGGLIRSFVLNYVIKWFTFSLSFPASAQTTTTTTRTELQGRLMNGQLFWLSPRIYPYKAPGLMHAPRSSQSAGCTSNHFSFCSLCWKHDIENERQRERAKVVNRIFHCTMNVDNPHPPHNLPTHFQFAQSPFSRTDTQKNACSLHYIYETPRATNHHGVRQSATV